LKDLLIMKFGGTSLGSAERFQVAARLVTEESLRRPVAIVASAMSGVTDLLLSTLRHAQTGYCDGMKASLAALRVRHEEVCRELLPNGHQDSVSTRLGGLVDEFERIAVTLAVGGEQPLCLIDEALAIGERLSVELLTQHLKASGTPAVAVNARDVVVTDDVFGNADPVMPATRAKALEKISPILERGAIPVMTGFNGATADGRPTTLGRGGSDFSASILAAALDASELCIWTDVDGILSADPRLVPHAQVLSEMTYAEARELASHGAKVLHPRTLSPLGEKRIPVRCKNSFAPEKPGTKIVSEAADRRGVRAVASSANVVLLSLELTGLRLSRARLMQRVLSAIACVNAELLLLTGSDERRHHRFLVRSEEFERVAQVLESNLQSEFGSRSLRSIQVDREVALLAVVGKGIHDRPALIHRISAAVSRVGVDIIAIAQDPDSLSTNVVVRQDGLERAVRAVHAECGLDMRVAAKVAHFQGGQTPTPNQIVGGVASPHLAWIEEPSPNP